MEKLPRVRQGRKLSRSTVVRWCVMAAQVVWCGHACVAQWHVPRSGFDRLFDVRWNGFLNAMQILGQCVGRYCVVGHDGRVDGAAVWGYTRNKVS